MPELVPELRRNLYVDDLLSGGATVQVKKHSSERKMPLKYLKTHGLPYTSGI